MNNFNNKTDYSEYNVYSMALSDNQGQEQQMALMDDSENPRHSTARKGDSALTAFLRSNTKQSTLSGTQHTNSTFDTFAQEQAWEDDGNVPDDESIVSIDIIDIKNDFIPLSSYKVPDDESIVSIDVNDIKNDLIPVSSYNEGAVDEALKWTEAFMAHDDDTDEESMEDEGPLRESMSSLNDGLEKLTKCMERSALSRQLITQYSDKSLGSATSTTTDISQHSFNHNDSLQLQNPLGPSSSHSTSSGLVKPRIKKAQNITRSGLIRRHSHRSISGQDITKRSLVKKDSLVSRLNAAGSLNSISFHGDSSWRSLSRSSSSFRKTKLSDETSRSPMDSS